MSTNTHSHSPIQLPTPPRLSLHSQVHDHEYVADMCHDIVLDLIEGNLNYGGTNTCCPHPFSTEETSIYPRERRLKHSPTRMKVAYNMAAAFVDRILVVKPRSKAVATASTMYAEDFVGGLFADVTETLVSDLAAGKRRVNTCKRCGAPCCASCRSCDACIERQLFIRDLAAGRAPGAGRRYSRITVHTKVCECGNTSRWSCI